MVKFATFAGQDGRPIYINPELVTVIVELNDKLCEIQFGAGLSIDIPLPIALVVKDIQKASLTG